MASRRPNNSPMTPHRHIACLLGCLACFLTLTGCYHSPLEDRADDELYHRLNNQRKIYTAGLQPGGVSKTTRSASDLALKPEEVTKLDSNSGPDSFKGRSLELGKNLRGDQEATIDLSLRKAIDLAVANNLEIQVARLQPAISQTQITQAKARFDALYFLDYDRQKLDTPRPSSALATFGSQQSETDTLTTGIRKTLTTGGELTLQTGFSRRQTNPSFFSPAGAFSFHDADVLLGISQPLLRGFGEDVNRAEIVLAKSAHDQSIEQFRQTLMDTIAATEAAYWELVSARQRLLVRTKELEATRKWRDIIDSRSKIDVRRTALTEANSQTEFRRSLVIRARQRVRFASDALKRMINDPKLLLSDETMIVPVDFPADLPAEYSLHDAIVTALAKRPEIKQSLYLIRDATIRQRVADNLKLPLLNLGGAIIFNGIDEDNVTDAYANMFNGDFIDYIINANFEYPIGNRAAQGLYKQRQIEHQQSVTAYRNTVQNTVLEVKNSLRNLQMAYELIDAARATRRAAAENFRAQETLWDSPPGAKDPVAKANERELRLGNILNALGRLADAQVLETQALIDYSNAITNMNRATGTLIERNGLKLQAPAPQDQP
jgi:outer membrane protein